MAAAAAEAPANSSALEDHVFLIRRGTQVAAIPGTSRAHLTAAVGANVANDGPLWWQRAAGLAVIDKPRSCAAPALLAAVAALTVGTQCDGNERDGIVCTAQRAVPRL